MSIRQEHKFPAPGRTRTSLCWRRTRARFKQQKMMLASTISALLRRMRAAWYELVRQGSGSRLAGDGDIQSSDRVVAIRRHLDCGTEPAIPCRSLLPPVRTRLGYLPPLSRSSEPFTPANLQN
ncbi:hypothetical protein N656DRAFT_453224 [Canariomyces notabilis]|uniref:Uncharacterized protein n=1 Tax=Canariomyces notabilis TaxID=2074819 RepID=A0AAN6QDC5_9PEZI|nr:hypothetical protein N656DRAFT_453224 [Canariomyces arenarius]